MIFTRSENSRQCAVFPPEKADMTCCYLDDLYGIPTIPLANFLIITLTPSNQIIHPGRVYGVFKDWDGKTPFKPEQIPMLYEEMDDFSADQMQLLDDEIQLIKKAILKKYPGVDLSPILPLKERIIKQYGEQVKDKSTLKTVFCTNQGYKTARFPMKQVEGGVVLDTNTRFFWEDLPYGLCVLKDIAQLLGVATPNVDRIAEWHQKFMGKAFFTKGKLNKDFLKETGCPSKYGIKNIEQLLKVTCNLPKANL